MTDDSKSYTGNWPLIFLLILVAGGIYMWLSHKSKDTEVASPSTTASATLEAIKQRGSLRIAFEPDSPPMYYAENGTTKGFDVELAEELAARLGVDKVEYVEADYDKLPELVKQGKADILMSGYIPDDSVEGISWSKGYLDFGFCLLAKKGTAIKSIQDLQGKLVGIYDDEVAEAWVKQNISGARTIKYQGTGWLKYLENGEVQGIVYDYPFAAQEIKKFPNLSIVGLNLNSEQYAIGVNASNTDLLNAINRQLPRIMESPRYERIVQSYLQSNAINVATEVPVGAKTYIVKQGDNLGKIASAQLGDKNKWQSIWNLNKNRIPNPHLITTGFELVMP